VLPRLYDSQACCLARALEVVGERWTLLIVRDAFRGLRRFDEFQESLGIARNVLAQRLAALVEHGILERVPYQERPVRHEYRLTPKGRELRTGLVALMQWGEEHYADDTSPRREVRHLGCGGRVEAQLVCTDCGETCPPGETELVGGPVRVAPAS
jgi:DNA-binding HxlR family transcriptional regulator